MGRVLDPNPTPTVPGPPAAEPVGRGRVVVYLDDAEREVLDEHAETLAVPVAALLRRCTVTAVRATRRAGVTARQLVDGAAAALARDFPVTFGPDRPGRAPRVAESVMRWLLARCAVLPLPSPTEPGVWRVRLDDGSDLDVTCSDGRVCVSGLTFTRREWLAVAAAGAAAANPDTGDREGVSATSTDTASTTTTTTTM